MRPRDLHAGGATPDATLPLPEFPLLDQPLGSLELPLRTAGPVDHTREFHVAGRRAFVSGDAGRGIDAVWAHPVRVAADMRLSGGHGEALLRTPVGVERRIRLGGEELLERIVVPRDAPVCLVEWLSRTGSTPLELSWTCDLRAAAPLSSPPTPLRWRRTGRGVVVAGADGSTAVFTFSCAPDSLEVEDASVEDRSAVLISARIRLAADSPVRLAIIGATGSAAIQRALASADRGGALARARQGQAERVLSEGLSLEAPDPVAVQDIEWAKHELEECVVEAPGVGRCLVPGYRPSPTARAPWPSEPGVDAPQPGTVFEGAPAVAGALAALAGGAFGTARDVLVFLGRHLDASGRPFEALGTTGFGIHTDPQMSARYLLLGARYMAWTGDLRAVRAEWPRLMSALQAAQRDEGGDEPALRAPETGPAAEGPSLLACALTELADAAEAIGEGRTAVELREAGAARGGVAWAARVGMSPLLGLAHDVLGCEPDATRGRLVLRPEPPPGWPWFTVRGLRMGDVRLRVHYRAEGGTHTLELSQERGAAPLQLILEPALSGSRLVSARVDGVAADLESRAAGDRLVVPVQLVMDHDRRVVLELDESTQQERRQD